jgi:cytoskeleton-associated protein 5
VCFDVYPLASRAEPKIAHYGDDVYDLLSQSFEDPSATIVYPYVYRILNSSTRVGADAPASEDTGDGRDSRLKRAVSPQGTVSSITSLDRRPMSPPDARTSQTSGSQNGHTPGTFSPPVEEPDPDAQLITIINHISSESTGALHKEGITELHQFIKAYPHKKSRVDKMLESTGPAFRKYITRALASRAAEDQERNDAVSHTLSSK